MFWFLGLMVAIVEMVYRAIYGPKTTETPRKEHPSPPIRTHKPEVLWGDPLTDEEWQMIQDSDQTWWN